MSDLKRKKVVGSRTVLESSSDEEAPAPKKPHRPFSVSQMGRTHSPADAPSGAQSQSSAKPPVSTPAVRQSSKSAPKPPVSTPTVRHSSKPTPKPSIPPTPRDTPALGAVSSSRSKDAIVVDDSEGDSSSLPESPVVSTRQKSNQRKPLSSDDEPPPVTTAASRPKVQMERELNVLRDNYEGVDKRLKALEESQVRTEQQQRSMDSKLDFLVSNAKGEASAPSASTSRGENPRANPVNPPPNPEHRGLAERIQTQRDRGKALEQIPSAIKAPAQTHARNTMKSLTGAKKVTYDPPPFYYKDGQPDFFPTEFTRDGYCKPYFHWDKPFADNSPCFSTYIDAYKRTITEDGSDFATAGKLLTDYQILALLHNGPFSSLATAYKKAHPRKGGNRKTSAEEKTRKREVSRLEAKTFARQSYRNKVEFKEMLSSKWNVAWSKSVMSPVLTDDEGGQVIEEPEWRAGWWGAALLAMDNADRAAELAKDGIHPPLPKTTTVIVRGPPPTIYTGKGDDKKVAKIPLALVSKNWRKVPANAEWIKSSAHIIDSTVTRKPDLSEFVKAHPAPAEPNQTRAEEEAEYEGGDEGEAQGDDLGEYDGGEGGEEEEEDEEQGEGGLDWMEGGESAGAQAGGSSGFGTQGLATNAGTRQLVEDESEDDLYASDPAPVVPSRIQPPRQEPEASQAGEIAIDPRLLQASSGAQPQARPRPRMINTTNLPVTSATQSGSAVSPAPPPNPQNAAPYPQIRVPNVPQEPDPSVTMDLPEREPSPSGDDIFPKPPPPMPTPPSLSQQERDTAAIAAASAPEPPAKKKRVRKPKQSTPGASTSTAPNAPNPTEAPVKRGRGRPKGVLNKSTYAKMAAKEAADAAEKGEEGE